MLLCALCKLFSVSDVALNMSLCAFAVCSLSLPVCLPACLSVCLPACLPFCLSDLSVMVSTVKSLQPLSLFLCLCLSVCLRVFLSTRFVLSLSGKMKSQESKTVVGIITKVIICQWRSLSCPHVCLCLQFKTRCYAMMKSLKSCKREIKPLIGGPGLSVSWRLLATVRQAPCTG